MGRWAMGRSYTGPASAIGVAELLPVAIHRDGPPPVRPRQRLPGGIAGLNMARRPVQRDGETDQLFSERMEAHRTREAAYKRKRYNEDPEAFLQAKRLREATESAKAARRERYARNRESILAGQRRRRAENPCVAEADREAHRRKWAVSADHPGICDCCGADVAPKSNGSRGLNQDHRHDNNVVRGFICTRCNIQVAVLDLAFTDPERFALLKAWSLRGAPVVPVHPADPKRRRQAPKNPTLFEVKSG